MLNGLSKFIRSAATLADDSAGSALDKKWSRLDPHSSEEVLGWYQQLLDIHATPAAWAPPIPPVPSSPGGNIMGPMLQTPSRTRQNKAKLGRIYYLVGIDHVLVGDCTANLLPVFWREFERDREKTHSARALLENELDVN